MTLAKDLRNGPLKRRVFRNLRKQARSRRQQRKEGALVAPQHQVDLQTIVVENVEQADETAFYSADFKVGGNDQDLFLMAHVEAIA